MSRNKSEFLIIVLVLFLYLFSISKIATINNGGFENKTSDWYLRHGYFLDTTISHSGTASLRTDKTYYDPKIDPTKGDARAMWYKSFYVSPGNKIVASAYIKTEYAKCTDGLRIGIDFKTMNGTILRAHNGEFVKWGNEWIYREINEVVRPGEERVTFWVQGKPYDCQASGWFDDISFNIYRV